MMNEKKLTDILDRLRGAQISVEEAVAEIGSSGFSDIGHTRVDLDRAKRCGMPEVIYCENKTSSQVIEIMQALGAAKQNLLGTRAGASMAEEVCAAIDGMHYNADARLLIKKNAEVEHRKGTIAVVCAGTSDLPVAEEAAATLEFLGNSVTRIYDSGVAGIHRLLSDAKILRTATVVIVVAGMEGALPSVVAGLIDAPVVAVPTSVGYGAAFEGLAALLGMLNSCSSGVAVMNIDNGFGAAAFADKINRKISG